MINNKRISVQVVDDMENDCLVVELNVDDSIIYEFSNVNGKITTKLFISKDYEPKPIDSVLLASAIEEAIATAKTLPPE